MGRLAWLPPVQGIESVPQSLTAPSGTPAAATHNATCRHWVLHPQQQGDSWFLPPHTHHTRWSAQDRRLANLARRLLRGEVVTASGAFKLRIASHRVTHAPWLLASKMGSTASTAQQIASSQRAGRVEQHHSQPAQRAPEFRVNGRPVNGHSVLSNDNKRPRPVSALFCCGKRVDDVRYTCIGRVGHA